MSKVLEKGLATMGQKYDISKNSQKLFNYLLCLAGNPPNMQKRVFQHKNINLSLISRTIDVSVNSIKKYWFELEMNHKIIYGDNNEQPEEEQLLCQEIIKEMYKDKEDDEKKEFFEQLTNEEQFKVWLKLWTARKKRPCEYYEVCAGPGSRKIPKETLKFLNEELQITEQDMKLYQFLLTYREIGIAKMYKSFDFSMMDLRTFLKKEKAAKNHLSIYKSLLLLEKLGLIEFKEQYELNSKNAKIRHFVLTNVNFYVKPEFLNCKDEERKYLSQELYNEIEQDIKESQEKII